ncbi:MAG: hypothetical protein V3V07_06960 [candidate division NC10 bacterium]
MRVPEDLKDVTGILFVCTGNMVRSPFAELYARYLGCPLQVSSAATIYRNTEIFPTTGFALLARGVPREVILGFQPRHLDDVDFPLDDGTVAFGMTHSHLQALSDRGMPDNRILLLTELLGRKDEIIDPVLDDAEFDPVFDTIAECVEALILGLRGHPSR